MEDLVLKLVREHPELGWIQSFLTDHPGSELFLVGGAVRDALLKRPTHDFDFVVRGVNKDELEKWFGARGQLDLVGRNFGVYKFISNSLTRRPQKIEPIDIALPRTESSLPGSLGGYREFEVEARMDLPIEMDLGRRDFTVNAIAFDLGGGHFIDPHDGRRDIEAQIIRAVGTPAERFAEDLSRLLRAIRFSCSLSFHIEENTWAAIQQLAGRVNDKNSAGEWVVPRETVGREFLKSFLHDPTCTLVKYESAGFANLLFPEFDFEKASKLLSDVAGLPPHLLVALFLSATDPANARKVGSELHFQQFPKEHRFHIDLDEVMWLIRSTHALDIVENVGAMPGSLFERLFLGPKGDDLLALMALTGSAPEQKIAAVKERTAAIREQFGDEIPELVSGDDLIKAGMKPGPAFREVMTKIRDAQFAGEITSKQEALEYLKTVL